MCAVMLSQSYRTIECFVTVRPFASKRSDIVMSVHVIRQLLFHSEPLLTSGPMTLERSQPLMTSHVVIELLFLSSSPLTSGPMAFESFVFGQTRVFVRMKPE